MILTAVEARVLGVLIEKEMTTPEYYPLTLNSLTLGCNQKNNREPITGVDEPTVVAALDALRDKKLVSQVSEAGARVPKYRHLVSETMGLDPKEKAVLCELLVRGPQTWAELRGRAARMMVLGTMEDAEAVLKQMTEVRQLMVKLPRQPGLKEARHAHTLCGDPLLAESASEVLPAPPRRELPVAPAPLAEPPRREVYAAAAPLAAPPRREVPVMATPLARMESDMTALRADVSALRTDVSALRAQLDSLLKQLG